MTTSAVSSPRPHVLHVITHLDLGGAERVALRVIEGLRGDMRFSLFAVRQDRGLNAVGEGMAARLAAIGVPVHMGTRRGFKTGGAIEAALALARVIAREGVDVVHLHTEEPELTFALAALVSPAVRAVPVLRTIHNTELWINWRRLGTWVTRRLARADRIAVSCAAATADLAIAAGPGRGLADVVYNGVEVPEGQGHRPTCGAPFRVLFAGRFVAQKGADMLPAILAAAHRAGKGGAVEVTIAGRGPMAPQLDGLAVTLPGWQVRRVPPIDDLPSRLAGFDCVLAPSRHEGFGLLVLEALLAGVPVVTCLAPGLAEVLPAGYPYAAPPGDCAALGALLAGVIADGPAAAAAIAPLRAGVAARFGVPAMLAAHAARYRALAR